MPPYKYCHARLSLLDGEHLLEIERFMLVEKTVRLHGSNMFRSYYLVIHSMLSTEKSETTMIIATIVTHKKKKLVLWRRAVQKLVLSC